MRLQTLGVAALRGEEGAAPLLGLGKPLALLIFLSAAPARTVSRAALVSLFWSDLEPEPAKHALRQTLWYLRRRTNSEVVMTVGDSVILSPAVRTDRDELLAASARSDHAQVVATYGGAFISTFATPGSVGFEEWAALERRRLLEVFRHSAETLIRTNLGRGHARSAIDLARRLRDEDVNDEGGWRLLLEACISAGEHLGARAEAQALEQLAQRDDIELQPATRAAIRVARAPNVARDFEGESGAEGRRLLSGTLVGRESPFAELLARWESAKSGKLVHVHLSARAGLGKTRLLRDVATRIRAMRGRVVTVAGSIGTRDIEYGRAGEVAAALSALPGKQSVAPETAGILVALNPSLSTYFDVPARHVAAEDALRARTVALGELAIAVSFEHPVALFLDDVHWWDESSSLLITALADQLRDTRILLVTAGRPAGRGLPLTARTGTRLIELQPLNAGQVEELVLSIAALPDEDWAARFADALCAAAQGSPLLTLEMLQLLEQRDLLHRESGRWATEHPSALNTELRTTKVLRARLEGMARADTWLLTLFATAGTALPLPVVIAASGRPHSEVVSRLAALEARGLVVRDGADWTVAHDEISHELQGVLTPESVSTGTAAVGRALYQTAPFSEPRARHAYRLLQAGDDAAARRDLFRRFARQRFSSGDRRRVSALAREFLGPGALARDVAEAVSATPWSWRMGLVSGTRRAAAVVLAGAVVVLSGIAMIDQPTRPSPDAVLGLVFLDSLGQASMRQVELREDDWSPLRELASQPWREAPSFSVQPSTAFAATWDPQRGALFTAQAIGEDGDIEIVRHARGHPAVRVAPAVGDDEAASVSPDGNSLAFTTSRWDKLSHYDVAVLNLADGTVAQLTTGPASDAEPKWSPDGRQLAFGRSNWGRGANEVCVVEVEGHATECREESRDISAIVLGWLDVDHIVVIESDGRFRRVRVLQWSTGDAVTVTENVGANINLSPDGRWVYCTCPLSLGGSLVPVVYPLAAPTLVRRIALRPGSAVPASALWLASATSVTPTRVTIDRSVHVAPVGVPIRLSATVSDRHGRELPFRGGVRWSLADKNAARIDSVSGVVVATGASPEVVVRATVGGTAPDSIRLRVVADSVRLRLEETWSDSGMARWIPFGKPLPRIVASGSGRFAFLNNGDGSFSSNAMSRSSFDGRAGLVLEFEISTPVSRPQWQVVSAAFRQALDTLTFSRSAGHNATPPYPAASSLCDVGYPAERRNGEREGLIEFFNSNIGSRLRVPTRDWLTGRWHWVRLQLLPDGRCGLALDGQPVGILPAANRPGADIRVVLGGNSVGARMLIGRVRVSEGVLRDIDWSAIRPM